MISKQAILNFLKELEKEFPYKIPGQPDTHSEYAESWQDCISRVEAFVNTQPENNGWIPCSERIPEEGKNVLIYTPYGSMDVAYISGGIWRYAREDEFIGVVEDNILAWQPLPAPYEVKSDE